MVCLLALLASDIRKPRINFVWLVHPTHGFRLLFCSDDEEGDAGWLTFGGWIVFDSLGKTAVVTDGQVLTRLRKLHAQNCCFLLLFVLLDECQCRNYVFIVIFTLIGLYDFRVEKNNQSVTKSYD